MSTLVLASTCAVLTEMSGPLGAGQRRFLLWRWGRRAGERDVLFSSFKSNRYGRCCFECLDELDIGLDWWLTMCRQLHVHLWHRQRLHRTM